jgi:hypothetical protein
VETALARILGFQAITVALIALGIYQLWYLQRPQESGDSRIQQSFSNEPRLFADR